MAGSDDLLRAAAIYLAALDRALPRLDISERLIVAGCAQVWSFTGMDPDDPETWYETRMRDGKEYGSKGAPGIMVEMCE